jgi:hypothetical protein
VTVITRTRYGHDLKTVVADHTCCLAKHIGSDAIMIEVKLGLHARRPATLDLRGTNMVSSIGFLHGIRHKFAGQRPAVPVF